MEGKQKVSKRGGAGVCGEFRCSVERRDVHEYHSDGAARFYSRPLGQESVVPDKLWVACALAARVHQPHNPDAAVVEVV